jgi:putative ABC transport system permease protein
VLGADPAQITQLIRFDDVAGSLAGLDDAGIAVSSSLAEDRGLVVGDTVTATFVGGGTVGLAVQAIYDTELPLRGPGWMVSQGLFDRNVPPALRTDRAVYVKLVDGSDAGVAATRPALEAVVDAVPGAEVQDIGEYQEAQSARADQFLLIVYVLLALALVIAIVGVVNTLLLSVHERTRELGLLRAVGMSRRQVRSSIRWESVIISLIGTITGLVIGIAFGWAVVRALQDDGITAFAIPWGQLVALVVLAALAGVGAALYPAWRAARLDVLAAIASE